MVTKENNQMNMRITRKMRLINASYSDRSISRTKPGEKGIDELREKGPRVNKRVLRRVKRERESQTTGMDKRTVPPMEELSFRKTSLDRSKARLNTPDVSIIAPFHGFPIPMLPLIRDVIVSRANRNELRRNPIRI
jgi:hypothetical protein